MGADRLGEALSRAQDVFRRRPSSGLHDDPAATARWTGGLRVVTSHASGAQVLTDMPGELGGTGDLVSPGWLGRAGVASCAATTIVLTAARQGIALASLEVTTESRSDTRGFLGMTEADGAPVYPGPRHMRLNVRLSAPGVAPERLRALVEEAQRLAPMSAMAENAVPMDLSVEVGTD